VSVSGGIARNNALGGWNNSFITTIVRIGQIKTFQSQEAAHLKDFRFIIPALGETLFFLNINRYMISKDQQCQVGLY